ncbi:MAG: hypothetical protein J7K23_03575 [Thermoproteales archaeon]|nr:hypothetical protein [Thermoproteales archaeon]
MDEFVSVPRSSLEKVLELANFALEILEENPEMRSRFLKGSEEKIGKNRRGGKT